jgi:hypothetical protein
MENTIGSEILPAATENDGEISDDMRNFGNVQWNAKQLLLHYFPFFFLS